MALDELFTTYELDAPPELPVDAIPLPGGAVLSAQVGFDLGSPMAVVTGLFGQVNTALTPLAPFFNVLDVVLALFATVTGIKDALTSVPPDPTKLITPFADLAKKAAGLLKLIPQLSLPATIRGIIAGIMNFLKAVRGKLKALITKANKIISGYTRAQMLNLPILRTELLTAKASLDVQVGNLNIGLGPVNKLVALVNAFMQLAGLGCLPSLGSFQVAIPELPPLPVVSIGSPSPPVVELPQIEIEVSLAPIDTVVYLFSTILLVIPDLSGGSSLGSGGGC
jgi:hypothetical protein